MEDVILNGSYMLGIHDKGIVIRLKLISRKRVQHWMHLSKSMDIEWMIHSTQDIAFSIV